ncbi:sensor histidine kinase [Haloplanus halophilus]|uniref:sensor histidine kinase n=1 Tax=Haloplanus halophilus TaxID=2949993 RepID=UPI0031B86FB6
MLHVDDDPEFVEMAATFLERADDRLAVETATSATEGLDRLADGRIDCVVCDYDMPGANGIEFLRAVREERTALPVILFTGKGSETIASEAISAGVTDYLRKGASPERYELLANRIENAVEASRSRRLLDERTRRLETLISNLPGVVYRCRNDPAWPMETVEGEVETLTGYTAGELERGAVNWGEDVVHSEDKTATWESVQEGLAADGTFEVTYRIVTADERTKWMWERGRAVASPPDGDDVLEGFITDITDRKERERELERRTAELSEFASIVSHDLRNPLNVARSRAKLARRECDTDHLDHVIRAHDRMGTLIDDLLTLARSGDRIAETEPVDLAALVERCWTDAPTADATLVADTDRTIRADRSRLRQLVENLVRNAVEHGSTSDRRVTDGADRGSGDGRTAPDGAPDGEGSAATVTVGDLDDGFYVADDGPGIPESHRDDVFDPGHSTAEEGTGFGLWIVAQVADAHGWTVDVTEGDGGGARFEFTGVDIVD